MASPSALGRGSVLVRSAFAIITITGALAVVVALGLSPDRLPDLLLSLAGMAYILVVCYRGDPWARWILVGILALGMVQAVLAALGPDGVPWWAAAAQIAWSAIVIALMQAPSARSFLAHQRSKRRRPAPGPSL
jgi:hypothetical protein